MIQQTKGKIFLSGQRGIIVTTQFRRYCTFNFGAYENEYKAPVGSLYMVNEEIIAGSQKITAEVAETSHIIILPITGALTVRCPDGNTSTVDVEEIQVNTIPANCSIQLANPYISDTIHFLQIGIKAEEPVDNALSRLFNFSLRSIENQLAEIISVVSPTDDTHKYPFSLCIGRFGGRKEAVYTLKNKGSQFFAFVVAGAFEIEGRLLHERDGLALWEIDEVEIEALSNDAIVIIIELIDTGTR